MKFTTIIPKAAWLLLFCALVLPAAGQRADRQYESYREEMEARVAAELVRRSRVLQWARTRNPSQEEIFLRLNQPVLEGTREGYERNMELARQFRERAEEARRSRQEDAQRRHAQTARAFQELAACHQLVYEGLTTGDEEKINEGYAKIPDLEAVIMENTRRRPPRTWLTPDEIRRYRRR